MIYVDLCHWWKALEVNWKEHTLRIAFGYSSLSVLKIYSMYVTWRTSIRVLDLYLYVDGMDTALKYNNIGTCATLWINVIQERASKVVSLAFSELYYACVVDSGDDSGDHTGSQRISYLCAGKKQRYHLRPSLSFHDTSARARSSIIIFQWSAPK